MKDHLLTFYHYNTWANGRVFDHLKQQPEDICREKLQSIFPSIFDALTHIYIVDKGWHAILTKAYASDDYSMIRQSVLQLQKETADMSLHELHERYVQLSELLANFIRQNDMSHTGLFSSVPMSYSDVFLHIVNHGTYHRGNISAMLHQLGKRGAPTDYGMYLYVMHQK